MDNVYAAVIECRARLLMRQITTLLFDWDGTVVDSAALGLAAFQKSFAEMEVAFPLDIYEATYSPNWYATYEALGLPREKWRVADELWLKHYGEEAAPVIQGAADSILDLRARDLSTGGRPQRQRRACRPGA